MVFHSITDKAGYFPGVVNIGYIRLSKKEGMLIDAGLEDQTMKKVIKEAQKMEIPITHLFITHAHADHYGGAAYLQQEYQVYTISPVFEAAILQHPMIEPLYLFHGVQPLKSWRNKFLEGKAVRVDLVLEEEGTVQLADTSIETIALPGHSYNQFGVIYDEVLFAGDGYFGVESLHKHRIPYIVDAHQTIQSIEKLKKLSCKGAVPGHGSFEENIKLTLEENLKVHKEIENLLYEMIRESPEGISLDMLITKACREKEIMIKNTSSYMLFRTAITAYLTKLMRENKVDLLVKHNQLLVESLSK
ncbi:MBL fold metallo-hydrolase [Sutcliffiella deserti]|uniref:MBL fold metallo-hydrolase n=1 Tax=Sutcliffiella deserti TaxID=2875501 RepID=UPI001CBD5F40|nr:MBL fold metallo-hydrolase [Sutcliffiella deserti]